MAQQDGGPGGTATRRMAATDSTTTGPDDDFLRRWAEVDLAAAGELRERLPDVFASDPPAGDLADAAARIRDQVAAPTRPYDWLVGACGWQQRGAPGDDVHLWLSAAASVVSPAGDPGWPEAQQSRIFAIRHRDWTLAVSGVVSAGAGADVSAAVLAAHAGAAAECDDAGRDADTLHDGFSLVLPLWRALGAVDDGGKLTALGWWGLPRALIAAWEESALEGRKPDETSAAPATMVPTLLPTLLSKPVAEAYERWRDGSDDDAPADIAADIPADVALTVAEKLAHARTAEATAQVFSDPGQRASWERFLSAVYDATAPSRHAAAVAVLLARAAEWREDTDAETSWLARALASDGAHAGALLRAAENVADAGDLGRAVALLRQAGERRDDVRLATYRQFATPPATDTPRNAPCPCGSGKKHKACCLNRAAHPLPARASLLLFKVLTFLHRPPQLPDLRQWGARAAGVDDPDSPAAARALRGSATFDCALWEGGLLDRFLAVRGPLLPTDERELTELWRPTCRDLYEVRAVRVGFAATLRPISGGAEHDVRDRGVNAALRQGDVVVARLLPVAGEYRLAMVLRVPPAERDRVAGNPAIRTDPGELLTWVREASARARG